MSGGGSSPPLPYGKKNPCIYFIVVIIIPSLTRSVLGKKPTANISHCLTIVGPVYNIKVLLKQSNMAALRCM